MIFAPKLVLDVVQSRNKETPSLLEDPDHAHSCLYQEGTSVKLRHDLIKLVLAELARQCNYHVEVEPDFPPRLESHYNVSTGESTITPANQVDIRGDLLLIRDNTRQLIDVTVARPTSMTHLSQSETSINGAHLHPLIAATEAEKYKHRKYDQECSTHGWKLVPFALESLGGKGKEATQLLQRMSAHCVDRTPNEFLTHANRLLSVTLQRGNAFVSSHGAADLLRREYHQSNLNSPGRHGRSGVNHQKRMQVRATKNSSSFTSHADIRGVIHGNFRSSRIGVRRAAA